MTTPVGIKSCLSKAFCSTQHQRISISIPGQWLTVDLIVGIVEPYLQFASPLLLLACVYLMASVLTEVVTNNAVAVILTPIVMALGETLGVDVRQLIVAVMFGASASFATPIGYQTNTFVYGAANYRFNDFMKTGIPMNVIVGIASCLAIHTLF